MIDRPGRQAGNVPHAQEWIDQCESLTSRRGHHIAFRRRGQGPIVLMLHGFPTWSYDYAAVAHDLADDHDVITLDFLGYGASDKPNPYDYSVADRPTRMQKLLILPVVGKAVAGRVTANRLRSALDALRGPKLHRRRV